MARKKKKLYIFPALLSALLAGSGQVIKGDGTKGLKIMLWFYFGIPAAVLASMALNAYLFLIVSAICVMVYPVLWILNIFDALTHQMR